MGGKSDAPAAPDYTPIAKSNEAQAKVEQQIAQDQLDWAKTQYYDIKPYVQNYMNTAAQSSASQAQAGQEAQDFYNQTYKPIEANVAQYATGFDTPQRRQERSAMAMGDVTTQFNAAREGALNKLTSFGVDPGSTRFSALDSTFRINEAAAKAAAGTQSALQTEGMGLGLQSEAINIGRGYPGSISNTFGTGSNISSQSIGSANQSFSTGTQGIGSPVQYAGLANQSNAGATSALNTGFNNQMQSAQFDAQQSGAFGSGIGNILGKVAGVGLTLASGGTAAPALIGASLMR